MYTNGTNFFKYITTEACTDRLKIPVDHRWNKEMEFPNRVILEDKHGNTWPVKLKLVEDQVCFVGGWLKFIKDNRVEEGNFLVFVNSGPTILSFRLYDSATRCETGGIFSGMTCLNQEGERSGFEYQTQEKYRVGDEDEECEEFEEEMEVEEPKYERSPGEEENEDDDDVDKELADNSSEDELEEIENDGYEEEEEEGDDDDDQEEEEDDDDEEEEDYDNDDDDDDDDEEEDDINDDDDDDEEEEEDDNLEDESSVPKGNIKYKKKGTTKQSRDIYGMDIFRPGGIPLPRNPYFVTCIRIRRKNELHVPAKVIKDYKLKLPMTAMIRDAHGRKWKTKLMFWKDGRILYRGGWASFCRVNLVEDHDLFICEFVHGDGFQPLTLSVYKV